MAADRPGGGAQLSDVINARLAVFDNSGQSSPQMDSYGVDLVQLYRPKGIAIDGQGAPAQILQGRILLALRVRIVTCLAIERVIEVLDRVRSGHPARGMTDGGFLARGYRKLEIARTNVRRYGEFVGRQDIRMKAVPAGGSITFESRWK